MPPQEGRASEPPPCSRAGARPSPANRFDVDTDGEGTPDVRDGGGAYVFERRAGAWREDSSTRGRRPGTSSAGPWAASPSRRPTSSSGRS